MPLPNLSEIAAKLICLLYKLPLIITQFDSVDLMEYY